ncbi:two pore domain potassium channel family protein, partial [[Brevibacterium] frigoritolerans]|nr:two pore domain potassium channel family protein [Peribacillus frigoritolerans]
EEISTLLDGIWWAIVTMSTVGYGDFTPVTNLGKIIGMVLILSGAGLITSYFAYIAKISISNEQQFLTGKKVFGGGGHIIIVGWNGRSKRIIQNIHDRKHHQSIVLIDDTLQKHPLPRTNIHFIKEKLHWIPFCRKPILNKPFASLLRLTLSRTSCKRICSRF